MERKKIMEDKSVLVEDFLELTAEIVSSHVSNNSVEVEALPGLIKSVYETLTQLNQGDVEQEAPEPAVPIRRSIQNDHIVCLEDGKKLKMLKRHLKTRYDMTPDEYRERWGLPSDYPMVAPAYAEQRRELAKKIGLGRGKKSK